MAWQHWQQRTHIDAPALNYYEDIDIQLSRVQIDICVLNYYDEDIDTKLS